MDVSITSQERHFQYSKLHCHIYLQPNSDINIPGRNLRCAEEYVSAETTRTCNLDGVLAAMGGSTVKSNVTTLVAVRCIDRP